MTKSKQIGAAAAKKKPAVAAAKAALHSKEGTKASSTQAAVATSMTGIPTKRHRKGPKLRGVSDDRIKNTTMKYGVWSTTSDARRALRAVAFSYGKEALVRAMNINPSPKHTVTRSDVEYGIKMTHQTRNGITLGAVL